MKYVLDVNVAFKWVLNEVDSPKARRLRDDGRAQVDELITPDVFPCEAAHALTRAERRRLITDASQFWGEIMSDCPRLFRSLPLAQRAAKSGRGRKGDAAQFAILRPRRKAPRPLFSHPDGSSLVSAR
jgi:hypothetical protein